MSLKEEIIARIAAEGPMRLDDYMLTCLLHPTKGYYATRDPLGAGGDFTTAPEISQDVRRAGGPGPGPELDDQGAPDPFVLAELGPGRGTLMADVLRATRGVPGFPRGGPDCPGRGLAGAAGAAAGGPGGARGDPGERGH